VISIASNELKQKVEALLFASGRAMSVEELRRLCRRGEDEIRTALHELQEKFSNENSLMLVSEGETWKLTVKEKYLGVVRRIVTKTELTKTVMETLAVLAFKAPMLQADLIKIRTNKAYDHLVELERLGYITRVKKGRTKLIRLSKKFFEYFDIPKDKLKEKFKNVAVLEHAIEEKEGLLVEQKKNLEDHKKKVKHTEEKHKLSRDEEHKKIDEELAALPEVDLIDDKGKKVELEQYGEEEVKQEVVLEEEKGEHKITVEHLKKEAAEVAKKITPTFKKGLYAEGVPEEVKSAVDRRVDELLHGIKKKEVVVEKEEESKHDKEKQKEKEKEIAKDMHIEEAPKKTEQKHPSPKEAPEQKEEA
jgi:segregation and condensation protein B